MARFEYKVNLANWIVEISKELVAYKAPISSRKEIQGNQITGTGIGLVTNIQTKGGGSVASRAIGKKLLKGYLEVSKDHDLKTLPSKMCYLEVAYTKPGSKKKKIARIPFNSKDPQQIEMAEHFKKTFIDKFVGVGPNFKVEKALGISQKAVIITVVLIILVIIILGVIFGIR